MARSIRAIGTTWSYPKSASQPHSWIRFRQAGMMATERDGFGVVEEGFPGDEGGDELGAPDVAGGTGDGEFVGVSRGHVHYVGHEKVGG